MYVGFCVGEVVHECVGVCTGVCTVTRVAIHSSTDGCHVCGSQTMLNGT